jgi:hypothetical protein
MGYLKTIAALGAVAALAGLSACDSGTTPSADSGATDSASIAAAAQAASAAAAAIAADDAAPHQWWEDAPDLQSCILASDTPARRMLGVRQHAVNPDMFPADPTTATDHRDSRGFLVSVDISIPVMGWIMTDTYYRDPAVCQSNLAHDRAAVAAGDAKAAETQSGPSKYQ